jgi:hypothetical protein
MGQCVRATLPRLFLLTPHVTHLSMELGAWRIEQSANTLCSMPSALCYFIITIFFIAVYLSVTRR